jgi:hypothetical protein
MKGEYLTLLNFLPGPSYALWTPLSNCSAIDTIGFKTLSASWTLRLLVIADSELPNVSGLRHFRLFGFAQRE